MILFNEQIKVLHDMVCRKKHLEHMIEQMEEQKENLRIYVEQMKQASVKEQADVEKLESKSLKAFLYDVLGKMDEKLSKEREEAYNASVKYESATSELQSLENDIEKTKLELDSLQGCEEQYEKLFEEKKEAIQKSGHWAAEKIIEIQSRIAYLDNQVKELSEALKEGDSCLKMVDFALGKLKSAEDWSTFDLFGGGVITDMAKYSDIEAAQSQIETLQSQLRRFKTELADVSIDSEMNIEVDGLLQFADIFFDNIFTDFAVRDKIQESKAQVENTKTQIESVVKLLTSMKEDAENEGQEMKEKLDELIVQVSI